MRTSLLSTKLSIPPTRPALVSRPRLRDRLDAGLQGKLILISAPAGFGKTTLVGSWLAGLGFPCTWFSLDEGDNDVARFLAYLVAALQQVDPRIGREVEGMLQSSQPPQWELLLTTLVNDIAASPRPFVLVLDDYHLIHSLSVHQWLAFLVERQPSLMHLVMVTREEPPLPLAHLRGRGQVADIRQADLRFTGEEAAEFLRQTMQLELSSADVDALQQRTEGWVAGLQLAALSLRDRDDPHQIVQSFTGSNRYILDYLIEEVFARQPSDVQEFLLQTSILHRFTAYLCDVVTQRGGSREMLLSLEQANLFIVPLDESREWYRYHGLFADLLRHRLDLEARDVAVLHRRASRWYRDHGLISDAMHHAVAALDWEMAADLILSASSNLLKQGQVSTLLDSYRALPESLVRARPRLCAEYSWPLLLAGQVDTAEAYLAHAERAAEGDAALLGSIAAAQAYAARMRGDGRRAVELSQRALALLPVQDQAARGVVAVNLGMAYWYAGLLNQAHQALTEAREAARQSENDYAGATAQVFLCRVEAARGKLRQAAESYRQTVEDRGQLPIIGLAKADLAKLLYEWNRLPEAADHAQEGLALTQHSGNVEFQLAACRTLALIKQAQGETTAAQVLLQECSRVAQRPDVSQSACLHVLGYQALIALLGGDDDTACRLVEQLPRLESVATLPDYLLLSYAQACLLLAREQGAAAVELLATRGARASKAGVQPAVIETLALQALAAPTPAQALGFLGDALRMAQPEGYVRTFLDLGKPMAKLLQEAALQGTAREYAGRLLAAFRTAAHGEGEVRTSQAQPLTEPLSDRELQVLHLVADGRTNQEIAQALYVSANTVKAHLKNIYGKLSVNSRRQATAKAKALGLIP